MKRSAGAFDAVRASRTEAGMELIAMAAVRSDDSILDIGCGAGSLTLELARQACNGVVVGIDPSAEMLDRARKRTHGAENIALLKMAAEEMRFASEFDLVYSNSSLHWIREQGAVIARAHKALRPGGRIAVQLPAKDFCWPVMETINSAVTALGLEPKFRDMPSPWRFPLKSELEEHLDAAGFSGAGISYRECTMLFRSINEVLEWGMSAPLRPYLARLSPNMRERFAYAFAMGFENYRTEKGIELSFKRLFAFAKKGGE